MIVPAFRWLAFAAFLSLLLVYFKGGTTLVKDIRRSVEIAGNYSYAVFSIIMALAGAVILTTQFLVCMDIIRTYAWPGSGWVAAAGAILEIAGILAAYRVRGRYLGRFWSGNVEIQPDHQIVESGPYRIIRHPIYTLTLIIYSGVASAFAVWWIWLACGTLMAGYILLTEYEDAYLTENLPGYSDYRNRTKWKLLPGIW